MNKIRGILTPRDAVKVCIRSKLLPLNSDKNDPYTQTIAALYVTYFNLGEISKSESDREKELYSEEITD